MKLTRRQFLQSFAAAVPILTLAGASIPEEVSVEEIGNGRRWTDKLGREVWLLDDYTVLFVQDVIFVTRGHTNHWYVAKPEMDMGNEMNKGVALARVLMSMG